MNILDGHDKLHSLTYQTSAVYTQVTVKACGPLVLVNKNLNLDVKNHYINVHLYNFSH